MIQRNDLAGIIVTYGFTGATTPAGFDAAATPRKTPLTFGVYGAGFKDAEVGECGVLHPMTCFGNSTVPYSTGCLLTPRCWCAATEMSGPPHEALNVALSRTRQCAQVLATAMAFQKATTFHKQRPPIDLIEPAILNNCTLRESPFGRCSLSAAVLAKLSETGIGNKPVDTIMTY